MYKSDDGPRNGPNLVTFVINCLLHDGTPMDTFIDRVAALNTQNTLCGYSVEISALNLAVTGLKNSSSSYYSHFVY